jgi:hypothetical protein
LPTTRRPGPPKKSGVVPPHSKAGEAPAVAQEASGRSASSGKAAGRFGAFRENGMTPLSHRGRPQISGSALLRGRSPKRCGQRSAVQGGARCARWARWEQRGGRRRASRCLRYHCIDSYGGLLEMLLRAIRGPPSRPPPGGARDGRDGRDGRCCSVCGGTP